MGAGQHYDLCGVLSWRRDSGNLAAMLWSTQPTSNRSRRLRITLAAMSSIAWIAALVLMGNEQWAEKIPVLFALGIMWRAMAYLWPERWIPGSV